MPFVWTTLRTPAPSTLAAARALAHSAALAAIIDAGFEFSLGRLNVR